MPDFTEEAKGIMHEWGYNEPVGYAPLKSALYEAYERGKRDAFKLRSMGIAPKDGSRFIVIYYDGHESWADTAYYGCYDFFSSDKGKIKEFGIISDLVEHTGWLPLPELESEED